jgi:hypothetical protein
MQQERAYSTFDEIVRALGAGNITVAEAVDAAERQKMGVYNLKFFEPYLPEHARYYDMRREWDARETARKSASENPQPQPEPEMVRCRCGHTISKALVMSTSRGSSCPDCYERMSV